MHDNNEVSEIMECCLSPNVRVKIYFTGAPATREAIRRLREHLVLMLDCYPEPQLTEIESEESQ